MPRTKRPMSVAEFALKHLGGDWTLTDDVANHGLTARQVQVILDVDGQPLLKHRPFASLTLQFADGTSTPLPYPYSTLMAMADVRERWAAVNITRGGASRREIKWVYADGTVTLERLLSEPHSAFRQYRAQAVEARAVKNAAAIRV